METGTRRDLYPIPPRMSSAPAPGIPLGTAILPIAPGRDQATLTTPTRTNRQRGRPKMANSAFGLKQAMAKKRIRKKLRRDISEL